MPAEQRTHRVRASFGWVVAKLRYAAPVLILGALLVLLPAARGGTSGASSRAAAETGPVLVGAGDIARCGSEGDEATAALLDNIPGTVFTLGDNAYKDGTAQDFRDCYEPSWGRHKARTRPSAGNHDYHTSGAAPYYSYFGAAAGQAGQGYYSYDLANWHIVVLNTECSSVGGCTRDSAQGKWLQADLAANPSECILAYWHRPLFSSGAEHGSSTRSRDFWRLLYAAGAEVILNGHEHSYERFAPQDPFGRADPAHGIREFVAGTGGGGLYDFDPPEPNSQVREANTHGVLKLTLDPGGYTWEFIPIAGETFRDQGSGTCSTGPGPTPDPNLYSEQLFMPVITRR